MTAVIMRAPGSAPAGRDGPAAGHLVPIGDSGFAVWRSFAVRRAGMPYDWIESAPADGYDAAHAAALKRLTRTASEPLFGEAVR
jgi:hypothetical protein